MKNVAVILAAGNGTRMSGDIKKQFLLLDDRPLLYYSLKAFENSKVEEIIVVTGMQDIKYCKKEVIHKYGFKKVSKVVEGGAERYISAYNGLMSIEDCKNVFIHDAARPMITPEIVNELIKCMEIHNALIVGVPVKDTIKFADKDGYVKDTPKRESLWQVQTPQVFDFNLIKRAYLYIMENEIKELTDDSKVIEIFSGNNEPVKIYEGYYENIKVTTPEDLIIAEALIKKSIHSG